MGVVYNLPTSSSLNLLEADLDDVMSHYNHVILLGDFNINMQATNSRSDLLLEFYGSLGMHLVNF